MERKLANHDSQIDGVLEYLKQFIAQKDEKTVYLLVLNNKRKNEIRNRTLSCNIF
jgi:hypothetical protein